MRSLGFSVQQSISQSVNARSRNPFVVDIHIVQAISGTLYFRLWRHMHVAICGNFARRQCPAAAEIFLAKPSILELCDL